ncbi:hypothetical protein [Halomonas sp. NO4]|nr:hypothetical protein [Halomonas sp. NO4]
MTSCPTELPRLTGGTGGDVALTMRSWAREHHHCATRHNGLVEALEKRR